MPTVATSICRWLANRPAYMLLTASDERLAAEPPERFAHCWIGLIAMSIGWGIGGAALYGYAWRIFGDFSGILMMPAALVAATWVMWPYRRSTTSLARVALGKDARQCAVGIAVIVLILTMAMQSLKSWHPDWPTYLPWYMHWIPRTMYRSLLLAPAWGGWAMLIAPQFCKPNERTEPTVAAMIHGCGAFTAALCMGLLLAATVLSFRIFEWNLTVPAWCIVSATVGGMIFCRRTGGPTRSSLLAVNMLTQLAFFLAYLAMIR